MRVTGFFIQTVYFSS